MQNHALSDPALIHPCIYVFEYPDGRIELRADGSSLEHVRFDKLPFIDAGAIVENKRLGHALRAAEIIQSQRDDRRSQSMPSRTNSRAKPRPKRAEIGNKRSSKLALDDIDAALQRRAAWADCPGLLRTSSAGAPKTTQIPVGVCLAVATPPEDKVCIETHNDLRIRVARPCCAGCL